MGVSDNSGDDTPPLSPGVEANEDMDDGQIEDMIDADDFIEVQDSDELADMLSDEETGDEDDLTELSPSIAIFTLHKNDVLAGDFHPNQKNIIATSGMDETLYVWNYSERGTDVICQTSFGESIDCLKFSPSGEYLAGADLDGRLKVIDTKTWTVHFEHDLGETCQWLVWHLFHPVIVAVTMGEALMINVKTKLTKSIAWRTSGCFVRGKFLPGGKHIALAYDNGLVQIVDLKTASATVSVTAKLPNETCKITSMDVHHDGAVILFGCDNGQIFSLATQSGKITFYPSGLGGEDSIEDIGFAKPEAFKFLLATMYSSGVVCFWDTSRQALRCQSVTGVVATQMVWHPTEPILFTSHVSGVALMIDGRTGNLLRQYQCHNETILGMALSSDASCLVTCSEDHTARVFQLSHENSDEESAMIENQDL